VSVETLEPDTVDPTVDPEREEAAGADAFTGRAPSADIPGGAEAMPVLWVVLTPAGIGRPRQARGPFVDPTEARAYGRELGGGYEVVEFVFPACPPQGRVARRWTRWRRRSGGCTAADVAARCRRSTRTSSTPAEPLS
jgi:hypothetical protein